MKALFLIAALAVGVASSASASTHGESTYRDMVRPHGHSRSDADYNLTLNFCYQSTGESRTAVHDTAAFKGCMLTRGWRFVATKVVSDPAAPEAPRSVAGRSYQGPHITVTIGDGSPQSDEDETWAEQQNEESNAAEAAGEQDMQDGIDAGAAAQAAASQAAFDAQEQAIGQQ